MKQAPRAFFEALDRSAQDCPERAESGCGPYSAPPHRGRSLLTRVLGILPRIGVAASASFAGLAQANPVRWQLNLTKGVTDTSERVYWLHNLTLIVCVFIGIAVFGAMIISMIRDRKSKGAVAAQFSHNTTAEIIWTIIPILILVGLAIPATDTLFRIYDTSKSEMTVKVTGYQWMWRYDYQGENVGFTSRLARDSDRTRTLGSGMDPFAVKVGNEHTYLLDVDHPLVLPINTKVRFVLTSGDVIHSWWVPDLGWKQDVIPGLINENWTNIKEPGVYRGQCAKLCGRDHAFMPIVVKAVSKAEFQTWLAAQRDAASAAATASITSVPSPIPAAPVAATAATAPAAAVTR